jgi:glycosyltransferase involved in cell wall biosynthesis
VSTVSTRESLRILQVSTADVRGGAEQVAWNLFTAYRALGHGSWLAVGEKHTDDPDVRVFPNDHMRGAWARVWQGLAEDLQSKANGSRATKLASRLAGALAEPNRRFAYYLGREDFDYPGTRCLLALADERPHVVHAHNLHGGYFDVRQLQWLSQQVPLLLTLHDAWLLSGHCAHSLECDRWRKGCGRCPDLSLYPAIRRDATAHNLRRKRAIFARSRLFVATPSRWLMQKVEKSILAPAILDARVIPNGIDLQVFQPGDRDAARHALAIPLDAPVVAAIGIDAARNTWKDLTSLRSALRHLDQRWTGPRIHVYVLGSSAAAEETAATTIRFVPRLPGPRDVAAYLQAADVYVHATRADTFPLAVLEAMACGRAVVASAVGGIPEQIRGDESGLLVAPGDSQTLAARLQLILSDATLRAMLGAQAAKRARRYFGFDRQVAAYLDWYADLAQEFDRERPRTAR